MAMAVAGFGETSDATPASRAAISISGAGALASTTPWPHEDASVAMTAGNQSDASEATNKGESRATKYSSSRTLRHSVKGRRPEAFMNRYTAAKHDRAGRVTRH